MKIYCPYCFPKVLKPSDMSEVHSCRRLGKFWRKSDSRWIPRFRCLRCQRSFSSATLHPNYKQNKRNKNQIVKRLLCARVSQREAARITGLNRKTIVRKLLYWGAVAEADLEKSNRLQPPAKEVEFDDMESFEHTKCKPLSIPLVVEAKTRRIIGFEVCKMPAKGHLASISLKKYGPREDERPKARALLFERVKEHILPQALIRSDSNPHYPKDIKKHFESAIHQTVLGKRGCVTGQGELKKVGFDPLFSLNHTCAMFRASVNRLIRKTWCTTKRPDRLRAHMLIYCMSHNHRLAAKQKRASFKKAQ